MTYLRLPRPRFLAARGVSEVAAFAGIALPAVLAARADVVAAFHYGDGWAAVRARRARKRPVVLKLTGIVLPDRIAKVRYDRRLFQGAVAEADEVWCNSRYAVEVMAGHGREMEIVPAGVDAERFRRTVPRSDPPVVLCTAAIDEPRKRVIDLVRAWPAVADALPGAKLHLAGAVSAGTRQSLLEELTSEHRPSVHFIGSLADDALVDAYSAASAVVAPAVYEALGLATLEALACGTPVAGARSGATADLVDDDVGALFEPDDALDCAAAVVRAAALSFDNTTRDRCRAAALPYAVDRVAALAESRFNALLAAS